MATYFACLNRKAEIIYVDGVNEIMWQKYGAAGQTTDDIMAHAPYMLDN
jgi:hypothetical protein